MTVSLQGLPGVRVVRSSSAFGFSMINVIFEDAVDLYFARTRVLERLNLLAKSLPQGVVPTLGPDATGVGHVFWYTVEGEGYSLRDLRSLQDWFIRYQLNAVPGVAEMASVGGVVRQYQIDVDPKRLRTFRISLSAVADAVMRSNRVGTVTLNTNMSMPGMSPMVAGATLAPEKGPGRYLGTISFPDSGARQVTVTWEGPARSPRGPGGGSHGPGAGSQGRGRRAVGRQCERRLHAAELRL